MAVDDEQTDRPGSVTAIVSGEADGCVVEQRAGRWYWFVRLMGRMRWGAVDTRARAREMGAAALERIRADADRSAASDGSQHKGESGRAGR